jgi:hypothetical protein
MIVEVEAKWQKQYRTSYLVAGDDYCLGKIYHWAGTKWCWHSQDKGGICDSESAAKIAVLEVLRGVAR